MLGSIGQNKEAVWFFRRQYDSFKSNSESMLLVVSQRGIVAYNRQLNLSRLLTLNDVSNETRK